ncbi:GNAT family N-acetyltransferase [Glycomyces tenuis]|uniref:GNAT family N-acetyltransferase n=2 Tax=Glycomyces tenuis TaxID=58116 RepID=UPI0012DDB8BC|nr:GNAT family N-acetyltransferase [Glycomyces tenuis]
MLGPEHIGRRVVVRRRLAGAAPGRRFSDVIGELIEIDAARLRVLPPTGTIVTVEAADVVAAKPVGPKPTPFSEILGLERLLAASWPAVESAESGGWLLRYSYGYSRRANSVLALTEPDAGLDAALAEAERWYAERGARPLIAVALPLSRRLDEALAARGWRAEAETAVLTKAAAAGERSGEAVIAHEPSPEFLEQVGRGRPEAAATVLGSGSNRAYAEIRRGGAVAARGRAALEGDTAAVSAIGTLPEHRRRGLGGEVLEALTAWAVGAGARRIALQVETDNAEALAWYGRLGFAERYRYHYRAKA